MKKRRIDRNQILMERMDFIMKTVASIELLLIDLHSTLPDKKRRQAGLKSWETRRTHRMVRQPDGFYKYEKIK